jgi:phosphomannomutase
LQGLVVQRTIVLHNIKIKCLTKAKNRGEEKSVQINPGIFNYADSGLIEYMDGISVTYPNWHFNVRTSNTEPLMRLNLESLDRAEMEQKRDEVLAIIRGDHYRWARRHV